MSERHGGEKPRFLPYGERAEARISDDSTFQEGVTAERVPELLAEARAERNRGETLVSPIEGKGGVVQPGLEHPPVTREPVGSNPIAPAAKILAARFSRLK